MTICRLRIIKLRDGNFTCESGRSDGIYLGNQQSVKIRLSNLGDIYPKHAPGQAGSAVALAALSSPCSPASCGHLLSGQGSREIEDSLFTGQVQIRFLTAPPECLCQGKLALQNCSLTGKCVSLFISHSHWKKGGVGEWLIMMSFFPRNFSKASHFTVT